MQGLKSFRKHFENPSGSDKAVFDRDFNPGTILNTELREFLATPEKVPYRLREEIAEVLIHELLSGKDYEIKDENSLWEIRSFLSTISWHEESAGMGRNKNPRRRKPYGRDFYPENPA